MPVRRLWRWTSAFGQFWYDFVIGDDWAAAAGLLVMLGAGYGLLRAYVSAWWAGPVVITFTPAGHIVAGGGNGSAQPSYSTISRSILMQPTRTEPWR
jgi:hypothetical protein